MVVLISILYLVNTNAVVESDQKVEWIFVPSNQLISVLWHPDGIEESGSLWTYICRVNHNTTQYAGKLWFEEQKPLQCCYGFGGKEHKELGFEVLFSTVFNVG